MLATQQNKVEKFILIERLLYRISISEYADYEGVRVKVTAYFDRTKKVLQMDIGFGDGIVPCATNK